MRESAPIVGKLKGSERRSSGVGLGLGAGLQVGMDLRVEAGLQVATGLRDDSWSGPVSGGAEVAR